MNGTSPRPNFDDFEKGFVAIFLFIIGDNWNNYMYANMIAMGNGCCFFFIMVQIFGKYILLNLFLAIVLDDFDDFDTSDSTT